jgi:7,8-dihydropterin-6-yl-methyl-4-(beta-D-ribofuranosyl)aminobenzene 5'-phosphate synthase
MSTRHRSISRRAFMGGCAAASLLPPLQAFAAGTLSVPEVDGVTLQVLVDNATFGPFLSDETRPGLSIERINLDAGQGAMTRSPLQAEFGLSLLAESVIARQVRRVLVDFGYSPDVLRHNLDALRLSGETIDAAVLSHGHLDHYGGFTAVFKSGTAHKVPLLVGGEEVFCERLAMIGSPPPLMGTLDRAQLATAGFDVRIAADPQIVAGHAFTTGTIPLQTFERAAIPTQMRPGVGCERGKLAPGKRGPSRFRTTASTSSRPHTTSRASASS